MSSLTLELKNQPAFDIDMSPLTPDGLEGKNQSQIKTIKLEMGNKKIAVSDLFKVSGKDSSNIIIKKSCAKLTHIGQGMTTGSIDVSGATGIYLGRDMKGGVITARGNASDWVGANMKGGKIELKRNVGHFLGAGTAGEIQGMSGGFILVHGNCGDRVGDRMRRGTIVVLGDATDYCGSRMIAGSIIVLGKIGKYTGFSMRRGTIILKNSPAHMLDTFQSCGLLKMEYLRLFFKQMANFCKPLTMFKYYGPEAIRYAGDHGNNGQGEIIVLRNTSKGSNK